MQIGEIVGGDRGALNGLNGGKVLEWNQSRAIGVGKKDQRICLLALMENGFIDGDKCDRHFNKNSLNENCT